MLSSVDCAAQDGDVLLKRHHRRPWLHLPERPAPLFRGFIAAALERAAARDGFEVQDARAPAGEAEGERAGLS